MPNRDERIDTHSQPERLTTNPFAALAGQLPNNLPEQSKPANEGQRATARLPDATPSSGATKPAHPFTIQRTRKGGYPISLEKRPSGKVVTVIRNVSGDAEALLKLLKKRCGAGGCLAENSVEIQGDHRQRIEAILSE